MDRVWTVLAAGVDDRASPMRTPVVATGGGGVDARVMVLRAADRAAATLTFFTDSRAAKVSALAIDPRVAVLAYDAAIDLQVRLRGTARIVTGTASALTLSRLPPRACRAYATVGAPGTPLSTSVAAYGDGAAFALLVMTVDAIDWLHLAGPEHRRAQHLRAGTTWTGNWCVP